VLDNFVPIGWYAALVPFTSGYRATWVAAGTAAFDLALLLTVTSLLRARVGLGFWRATHWLAYGLWPLALTHYLGAGTDARTGWGRMLAIVAAVAVAGAIAVRVATAAAAAERSPAGHPARGAPVRVRER
jgi:sulfoxide reductase heme-binding subunit YedZ